MNKKVWLFFPALTSADFFVKDVGSDVGSEVGSGVSDDFLNNLAKGPPPPKDEEKEINDEAEKTMKALGSFPDTIAYRPQSYPYDAFKHRCTAMVQSVIDRAGYDPERLHFFMPPCLWDEKKKNAGSGSLGSGSSGSGGGICKSLTEDLKTRLAAMGEQGGNLPEIKGEEGKDVAIAQPVKNLLILKRKINKALTGQPAKERSKPAEGQPTGTVFDWCNVVYNVMKERKIKKSVKELVVKQREEAKAAEEAKKKAGSGPGGPGSGLISGSLKPKTAKIPKKMLMHKLKKGHLMNLVTR